MRDAGCQKRRMLMLFERNGVAGRVWPPYCRDSVIAELILTKGSWPRCFKSLAGVLRGGPHLLTNAKGDGYPDPVDS